MLARIHEHRKQEEEEINVVVAHHLKAMPANRALIRARVEPLRHTIMAENVSTSVDRVRIHESFGANHASQLIVKPLGQTCCDSLLLLGQYMITVLHSLQQNRSKGKPSAPRHHRPPWVVVLHQCSLPSRWDVLIACCHLTHLRAGIVCSGQKFSPPRLPVPVRQLSLLSCTTRRRRENQLVTGLLNIRARLLSNRLCTLQDHVGRCAGSTARAVAFRIQTRRDHIQSCLREGVSAEAKLG